MSDTYTQPVSEQSSGKRGDFVGGGTSIRSYVNKELGIPPGRRGDSVDSSDPKSPLPKGKVPFGSAELKDTIINQKNTVKLRPVLLAVSGLPKSGKTNAIDHLMKHHVEKSPYTPISHKGYTPRKAQGIIYFDLVAVGVHHLQIVEITSEFSCAFGIMSVFKKKIMEEEQVPLLTTEVRSKRDKQDGSSFEDSDLQNHLENVFRHISHFEHIPKGQELSEEEERFANHLKKLPSGTTLINVWNIDINKTALYCLHALFGQLYSSRTWLFLDMERDLGKLYEPPENPSNAAQPQTEEGLAVKWRPRLHYLLRASKLSHGGSKCHEREGVCTIFAKHSEGFNGDFEKKVKELQSEVDQAARHIGVSRLLEPKIVPINLDDTEAPDDFSQRLYQKFHQVICEAPYEEEVPLSWIFLRSLFYHQQSKKHIKKEDLRAKAKQCNIDDESFEKFCRFYSSFGSIIDFTLINPKHELIVLAPIDFLRSLDKILHPEESFYQKYPIMNKGIVSETICKEMFGGDRAMYMDALISIGLAAKVTNSCEDITPSDACRTDALYYIPQMRKKNTSYSKVNPSAVFLITSVDSPHIYKQARFVQYLIASRPTANLKPCPEENRTVVHDVSTDTTITFVSFSPATMIEISTSNDKTTAEIEEVYSSVVKACHEVAKPCETGVVKYQFIVMCAKNASTAVPFFCHQHILPDEELCDACCTAGRVNEQLTAWKKALTEDPIKEDCRIDEELTICQMYFIAKELSSHYPELVPKLAELLETGPAESRDDKLILQMLLNWSTSDKPLHMRSRRALARHLLTMGGNRSDDQPPPFEEDVPNQDKEKKKRSKFFLKLARELDAYAKY